MVINGAMSGETFLAYFEQCLVPTLRRNDIVVMDNLRANKVPGVRAAIAGLRRFLSRRGTARGDRTDRRADCRAVPDRANRRVGRRSLVLNARLLAAGLDFGKTLGGLTIAIGLVGAFLVGLWLGRSAGTFFDTQDYSSDYRMTED